MPGISYSQSANNATQHNATQNNVNQGTQQLACQAAIKQILESFAQLVQKVVMQFRKQQRNVCYTPS